MEIQVNTSLLQDKTNSNKMRCNKNTLEETNSLADRRKRCSILLTVIEFYTIYYSTEKAAVKRKLKNNILNRLKRYNDSLEENFAEYTKYDIIILQLLKQLFALELQEIQGYIIRTEIQGYIIRTRSSIGCI